MNCPLCGAPIRKGETRCKQCLAKRVPSRRVGSGLYRVASKRKKAGDDSEEPADVSPRDAAADPSEASLDNSLQSRGPPEEEQPEELGSGRYEILHLLGRGGMGVVYQARDRRLGREVALKRLRDGADAADQRVRRFISEAKAVAALNHPHVVAVYDIDADGEGYHISMELVSGGSLSQRISGKGPLKPLEAVEIIRQVASALDAAHEAGIIHRDVKPGNILITSQGQARLSDFGLARVVHLAEPKPSEAAVDEDGGHADANAQADQADQGDEGTRSGAVLGTLSFMAPEQAQDASQVDHRADVYGLAGTLYCAVTGYPPKPIRQGRLPVALRRPVMAGLAEDPAMRPNSCAAFMELVDVALGQMPGKPHSPPATEALWPVGKVRSTALGHVERQAYQRSIDLLTRAFGGEPDDEEALRIFRGAEETLGRIQTALNRAREAMGRHRYGSAARAFKQVLELDSSHEEASSGLEEAEEKSQRQWWWLLRVAGMLLLILGIAGLVYRAVGPGPEHARTRVRQGLAKARIALAEGDATAALATLEKARGVLEGAEVGADSPLRQEAEQLLVSTRRLLAFEQAICVMRSPRWRSRCWTRPAKSLGFGTKPCPGAGRPRPWWRRESPGFPSRWPPAANCRVLPRRRMPSPGR